MRRKNYTIDKKKKEKDQLVSGWDCIVGQDRSLDKKKKVYLKLVKYIVGKVLLVYK